MKKILILFVLGLFAIPIAFASSWVNTIETVDLVQKDANWDPIGDDCGELDYTEDGKVNNRDRNYVRRNRIDADGSGEYDRDDLKFMRDNYENCRAGNGVVELKSITRNGRTLQERVRVSVWNLEPRTEYTLIYYGNEEENDVYPYATCIRDFRTSTQGYAKAGSTSFEFSSFLGDDVGQKFWVVKSADLDCSIDEFVSWNPEDYLFETETI